MIRSSLWHAVVCVVIVLFGAKLAHAQRLFTTSVDTTSGTASIGSNSAREIPSLFDETLLEGLIGGYDPAIDPFQANLDLRGLPAALKWDPSAGELTFIILGEVVTFNQADLDDALEDFDDWLKGAVETVGARLTMTDLLQGLVEFSPVDPIAGNPNSLQSRLFQTDYRLGLFVSFPQSDGEIDRRQLGVGLDYGYAAGGPYDVHALDFPLDYRFNLNSKWTVLASLPLIATFTEGRWSVLASGGVGVQYRPFDWWALTPMGRVGGAGSVDVGALAILYSFTMTNHMHFEWRGITFAMGNLGGFSKTIDGIEIGGYEFTYDLTNPVMTHGGTISGDAPFGLRGRPLRWQLFGWNTQIFGNAVYMDSQSELGASVGFLESSGGWRLDTASISLSYLFGNQDYDAMSLRVRFRF